LNSVYGTRRKLPGGALLIRVARIQNRFPGLAFEATQASLDSRQMSEPLRHPQVSLGSHLQVPDRQVTRLLGHPLSRSQIQLQKFSTPFSGVDSKIKEISHQQVMLRMREMTHQRTSALSQWDFLPSILRQMKEVLVVGKDDRILVAKKLKVFLPILNRFGQF